MIGQTISHYKILEKLGEGGMGVVYKAHDTLLDRDVALKFLLRDVALSDEERARFIHEAKAASALEHPNICTIHDVATTDDGQMFIVMGYYEGESLSKKIEKGRLDVYLAVWIAIQIAEGLQAAHEKSIVHRDIKSSNIIISDKNQVKILDFGLARKRGLSKLTKTGTTVGTASYMSPEQAQGEKVDHRTDIWSLGVILYEMITGHLPFRGEHEAAILYSVVNQEPEPIKKVKSDVSPELEAVVKKAMAKSLNKRYLSAEELLQDLQALREGLKPKISITQSRRWLIPALIIAGIVMVSIIMLITSGRRETVTQKENVPVARYVPTAHQRKSVAVIGFKNLSGQGGDSWISTALSEMLTTELSVGNQIRTIPGENVTRMKIDISLSDAESYAKETLSKIRNLLGTDYIVFGSYLVARGQRDRQLRVDLRIQDASAGETVATIAEVSNESKIFDLVAKVGSNLRNELGIKNIATADVAAMRASYQTSDEAIRLYAEGLDKLRHFDAMEAKVLFTKAIRVDSNYPHARSALAEAWNTLGYVENAKNEAKRAFELSENTPKRDRLLIEGRYREYFREWDQAAEIYKKLWSMEPDNNEFGIRIANVYMKARKAKDILETVDKLKSEKLNPSDEVQVDLAEAEAWKLKSENQKGKALCDSAVVKAEKQGVRILLAKGLRTYAEILLNMDRFDSASVLAERAKQIYSAVGNRFGEATCIMVRAQALRAKGEPMNAKPLFKEVRVRFDEIGAKGQSSIPMIMEGVCFMDINMYDSAKIVLEKSLKILKQIDDQYNIAICLNYSAINDRNMGKNDDALKKFKDVEKRWRKIGNKEGIAHALNNTALVYQDKGNVEEAKKKYAEAEVMYREIGLKSGIVLALLNSAILESELGELRNTTKKFEEALSIAREIKARRYVSSILFSLGYNYYLRDELQSARQVQEEALSIANDMGGGIRVADRLIMISDLDRVEGKPQNSEMSARKALALYKEGNNILGQIRSYYTIAWAHLLQDRLHEAGIIIDSALYLLTKQKNNSHQVYALMISAKILAGEGHNGRAISKIDSTIRLAKSNKILDGEFETRIALGEVMMKAGKQDSGASVLKKVETDARSRDFLLFAEMARKILKQYNF